LTILRFPFTATRHGVRILATLPRLPALTQDNAALRAQLLQRQLEVAQLREALRQAQQAQALAGQAPGPGLVASVIGRSTLPTQQTVLLDRGRAHHVAPDSVVVDASGVIGRVVDVQPTTALAVLLTDPDSRVAAVVERSREMGLLVGQGRGQCRLVYLDVAADLQPGDAVVTAGLGGPFPKGLLLGTITQVMRDAQAGFAWAMVTPSAKLSRAEEVLCLRPQER